MKVILAHFENDIYKDCLISFLLVNRFGTSFDLILKENMKKIYTLLSLCLVAFFAIGQGTWVQKATCPGSTRYRAYSFEVNGKCYMGGGSPGATVTLKDHWEYDVTTNTWTQKADLPGPSRENSAASSLGNYGYVGLGYNGTIMFNDWYEYDPSMNTWSQKANFPGVPRFLAASFMLQNRIFVGGGLDSASTPKSDFYAYDPTSNTWAPKANLITAVGAPATFVLNNKGYFIGGLINGSVSSTSQTQVYDPVLNSWSTKAAYTPGNTFSAVGFSLFGFGYVGTGFTGSLTDVMYRYDPTGDNWTQETSWPTGIRQWATSCISGNRVFVGTGNSTGGNLYADWWEFIPATTGMEQVQENAIVAGFNPDQHRINLENVSGGETINIYSIDGKLVYTAVLLAGQESISWQRKGNFLCNIKTLGKSVAFKIRCLN